MPWSTLKPCIKRFSSVSKKYCPSTARSAQLPPLFYSEMIPTFIVDAEFKKEYLTTRWEVAAHNTSIRLKHRLSNLHQPRLSRQAKLHRITHDDDNITIGVQRTIFESLPEHAVSFQRPKTSGAPITIIRTHSSCVAKAFTKHPFVRDQARNHL